MPTILIKDGYRFFFFSREGKEPAHIHVEKGGFEAKFWLDPPSLARNHGFPALELSKVKELVADHRTAFMEAWNAHSAR